MPLIKRMVEPTELSRAHIGQGIRNELECVTNNTLANVIRQLSSLSKHAEDMFDELTKEATTVFHRANNIQDRIDKLRVKVTQLDSTVAVVSLQEINMRKPFKSSVIREQQIISKDSRPRAIQDSYLKCDAPPALSKLNIYREDGKDSLKFYTDSTYFFELWRAEMEKDTENQRQIVKQKVQKKRRPDQRAPVPIKQVQQKSYTDQAMGEEFQTGTMPRRTDRYNGPSHLEGGKFDRPNSLEIAKDGEYITPNHTHPPPVNNHPAQYQNQVISNGPVHNTDYGRTSASTPQANYPQQADARYGNGSPDKHSRGSVSSVASPARPGSRPPPPPGPASPDMGSRSSSRTTLPPPPPPPPVPGSVHASPVRSHEHTPSPLLDGSSTPGSMVLPPPPPPAPHYPDDLPRGISSMPPPPPSPPMEQYGGGMGGVAPPPPPPPPPMDGSPLREVRMNASPPGAQPSPVSKPKKAAGALPEAQAGRNELLEAIRQGINLRQGQQQEDQCRRKSTSKLDVQSIMEAAFEMRRRAMEENDSEEEGEEEELEDWED